MIEVLNNRMIEMFNNRMIDLSDKRAELAKREEGFTSAELLGNAALGVAALAFIWIAMRTMGVGVVDWIEERMFNAVK